MNEFAAYAWSVMLLPALVAVSVAAVAAVGPLRRRAPVVDGVIAFALMLAFVLSFTRELEWSAILRQCMTIEGDDAPFERWHRLGLAAAMLAIGAPLVTVLGSLRAWKSCNGATVGATLLAAILSACFVVFPGSTLWWQLEQGLLVIAAITAIAACAQRAILWSAWIMFAVFASLAMLTGYASLAAMSAAVSIASFLIALLMTWGDRRDASAAAIPFSDSIALVLGVMAALVANCGRAYDYSGLGAWPWIAAALVPAGSLVFAAQVKRASSPQRAVVWKMCGVAVAAMVLAAAIAVTNSTKADESSADEDSSGMYGDMSAS